MRSFALIFWLSLTNTRLFTERTKQLNEELATLEGPAITHPEYLSMVEAIANQRRERVELAKTGYRFKVKALQVKSVAERTQHHSQYMQSVREIRDLALERANKEWYQIQRERRTFDEDGLSGMFPCAAKRSELVAQQNAYNTEVSILSGIAKHVGFPAAPEIDGVSTREMEEDLRKMGVSLLRPRIPHAGFDNCRYLGSQQLLAIHPPCHSFHATDPRQRNSFLSRLLGRILNIRSTHT